MQSKEKISELSKIIKRLELIKTLILLEEEEEIIINVDKLKQLPLNEELQKIIVLLDQSSYGKAIKNIEEFLNSHHQVAFYIDPEIEALRFEAKSLERQIQELSNEKAELDKVVHEFGVRHNHELGKLIIKILQYRKKQSEGTPQYEEAEKEYKDFYTNYQVTKDEKIAILTEEEQKELKACYRKASKLCHPDVVNESQKKAAHRIFMELNVAYKKNDLKRVIEILESLQQGKAFTSKADTANEKLTLQAELERLRKRLHELNKDIIEIKTSETYQSIININDWDEYFAKTKQELQGQLNELENGRK